MILSRYLTDGAHAENTWFKKWVSMKPRQPQDDSQPFLLRVWKEEIEGGGFAWSGRLQHIVKGDAHLFRSWIGLIELLETNLQDDSSNGQQGEGGEEGSTPEL